jgi:hypothetical protein
VIRLCVCTALHRLKYTVAESFQDFISKRQICISVSESVLEELIQVKTMLWCSFCQNGFYWSSLRFVCGRNTLLLRGFSTSYAGCNYSRKVRPYEGSYFCIRLYQAQGAVRCRAVLASRILCTNSFKLQDVQLLLYLITSLGSIAQFIRMGNAIESTLG